VHNNRPVAHESRGAGRHADIVIDVAVVHRVSIRAFISRFRFHSLCGIGSSVDLAMLAREIANLASRKIIRDASWAVSTTKGIQVASSSAAVAVQDRVRVDVIEEGASLVWEAGEADLDKDTGAAGIALSNDGAAYVGGGQVGQSGSILHAWSVVGHGRSILGKDDAAEEGKECKDRSSELHDG